MVVVALILYAAAFVCFVCRAGRGTILGLEPLGLGLACCALLWFFQVLVPAVSK